MIESLGVEIQADICSAEGYEDWERTDVSYFTSLPCQSASEDQGHFGALLGEPAIPRGCGEVYVPASSSSLQDTTAYINSERSRRHLVSEYPDSFPPTSLSRDSPSHTRRPFPPDPPKLHHQILIKDRQGKPTSP